jgi:hypothetical protein
MIRHWADGAAAILRAPSRAVDALRPGVALLTLEAEDQPSIDWQAGWLWERRHAIKDVLVRIELGATVWIAREERVEELWPRPQGGVAGAGAGFGAEETCPRALE